MFDLTYEQAIANREHLIALGQDRVWLRDDTGFPYDKVIDVEAGNTHRLNGPASARLIAQDEGLTFSLNVEFEGRDANGKSAAQFDRDRLREIMAKIPLAARQSFARMLAKEVLPALVERTGEFRRLMRQQADSEDCVRGLIAFGDRGDGNGAAP